MNEIQMVTLITVRYTEKKPSILKLTILQIYKHYITLYKLDARRRWENLGLKKKFS